MRLSQKKYQELLEHKDTKLICTGFPEIFLSDFLGLSIKIQIQKLSCILMHKFCKRQKILISQMI